MLGLDLWSTTGTDMTALLPAADLLVLNGAIDLTAGPTLKLGNPNALTFQPGDIFRLFDWSGTSSMLGTFTLDSSALSLAPGTAIDTSSLYSAGTISFTAVPEPGRVLLLLTGVMGGLLRRRRVQAGRPGN